MMIDFNANAVIRGEKYYARIEQYDTVGYLSLSGGPGDSMVRVDSPDVYGLALLIACGVAHDLPLNELAVLGMAGLVFTAERRGNTPLAEFI